MLLRTFCTATCVWALAASALEAQQRDQGVAASATAADEGQIDSVVRRGQKLENEHRWGEAVTLYEEALRKIPPTAAWPPGTSWPRFITISAAATTMPVSCVRSAPSINATR